ncbi:flavocytochrome c [uncultured Ilyobacter sp.]|uniref:flavocytochrome c n=1 Tax=uncultured Ilyobacter sp. TaxID=544433 RepID=UPI0029F5ABE9|nr:flavocytochrome c [uncultured Ilyobacter sp.]
MKKLNDGKFYGTGIGYGGDIKLSVEIEGGRISKIDFLEHNETPVISDPAFDNVPGKIIEKNSILVPNVSGCSVSSRGIREAVKNALVEAGGDIETLEKEILQSETLEKIAVGKNKLKEKEEFDVVIVGAGGAGLAASISAAKKGASVVVLEKTAAVGGNTLVSMGGINIPGNAAQRLKKLNDSHEIYFNDALTGGDGENNQELLKILSENALPTYEWLKEDVGVEFKEGELIHFGGHSVPRAAVFKGKYAVELITKLKKKALSLGVDIRTGVKAEKFIVKDSRVEGITASIGGSKVSFMGSKGVIMTTGGFSGNIEMRKKHNPELDERYKTTNQSGITGDGHVMCEKVQAGFVHMDYIQTFPISNPKTGALSHVGGSRFDGAILINKQGNRFVEELERRDVVSNGILSQEGGVAYLLWGQEIERVANRTQSSKTEVEALKRENLFCEGDLKECADFMGINTEAMMETLEKYNGFVASGKDEEFSRRGDLLPIKEGPFYIQAVAPAVHHTMGGVTIDDKNHVMDIEKKIIPGLFAAGEIVGGIHGTNRLGGNAITDILVFGKRAGENIMND